MFSVATLTLASPVYLRMMESPGVGAQIAMIAALQIVPAVGLALVDAWLDRRVPRGWRLWRVLLAAGCLLAVARQAQLFFRLPTPSERWTAILLVAAIAVVAGVVALGAARAAGRFLAALAPGLVVWTIVIMVSLWPPAARAAPPTRAERPPAVFVLLFDELDRDIVMPDGRVREDLASFRRLAQRSRLYVDATANYAHTCASVGSLLTGRLFERMPPPGRDCLRSLPGFADDNVLTAVAARLPVRVYGQYLAYCFDRAFRCLDTAHVQARAPYLPLLQHYVPDHLRSAATADSLFVPSEHTYLMPVFTAFLRGVRADARGTLSWLHVVMPHAPYVLDERGVIHWSDHRTYGPHEADYRRELTAYRRQVGFADRLLGRFLDRLEAEGLAEDAIVVVTSDHGFHQLPGAEAAQPVLIGGFEVTASRPRIPLIVRASGLPPGVVHDDYQHIDFKRLLLGLIDGVPPSSLPATPRDKRFCDNEVWRARDADGRWRPQLDADGRPRPCAA